MHVYLGMLAFGRDIEPSYFPKVLSVPVLRFDKERLTMSKLSCQLQVRQT
jgi:hypothetical protein